TIDPEVEAPPAGSSPKGEREAAPRRRGGWRLALMPLAKLAHGIRRFLDFTIFSNLTRRIVVLNLAGLLVLVVGILYLNQWRAGLIDARVQSLRVQGEIIAAAIAASATVDSDVISVNPDRLLELQAGNFSPLS